MISNRDFQKLYDEATPEQRAEFNRRHRICLQIAICIKVIVLVALIYYIFKN